MVTQSVEPEKMQRHVVNSPAPKKSSPSKKLKRSSQRVVPRKRMETHNLNTFANERQIKSIKERQIESIKERLRNAEDESQDRYVHVASGDQARYYTALKRWQEF